MFIDKYNIFPSIVIYILLFFNLLFVIIIFLETHIEFYIRNKDQPPISNNIYLFTFTNIYITECLFILNNLTSPKLCLGQWFYDKDKFLTGFVLTGFVLTS